VWWYSPGTGKALSRLNEMFRTGKVRKTYHAIVPAVAAATVPQTLDHWLTRNERQNKAYAHPREVAGSKHALLDYVPLACGERYALHRGAPPYGTPSPDTLPVGHGGAAHQGRPEIRGAAEQ